MMLYISGGMQDAKESSFPYACEILTAEDLRLIAAGSDYCMAEFADGYTDKGVFKTSHRAARDFIKSDVLYADIDNKGCTANNQYSIEKFKKQFEQFSYFITTSKSHQKGKDGDPPLDRFHVFFPLEHAIEDKNKMKGYLRALHKHAFKMETIDRACIDVARVFYGNPSNESWYHDGKSIHSVIDANWKADEKANIAEKNDGQVIVITDPMRNLIIGSLDKAYTLGWFDEYSHWINLGIALKQAGFNLRVWLRYCHTLKDVEMAERKWETFHPDGSLNGMQYLYQIHSKLALKKVMGNKIG